MSGLIPQLFINQLLEQTDLVELIDSYLPLKKRGLNFTACCPFHNEKTPSFNVVAKKQFYHCFGCGASGNAISFVSQYLSQAFPEAVETLAARIGVPMPENNDFEKKSQSLSLYQLLNQVTLFYQHALSQSPDEAQVYLKKRNINENTAKQFEIGFATNHWQALAQHFRTHKQDLITTGMLVKNKQDKTYDRYRHRIIFPIRNRRGHVIAFGGRAINDEDMPKYLNSPETVIFQKNRELYGLYQVLTLQPSPEHIIIVEGYLDVIALAQHGINNAVATLGTATSLFHIQSLSKYTQQLIFCFDGDNAGVKAAWRALEACLSELDDGLDVRFMFLPLGQDPDSFVHQQGNLAFLAQIKQAMPLNHYLIKTLTQELDLTQAPGVAQLLSRAKPYLIKMPEGATKQLLINELSQLTRIENHRISQLIKKDNHQPLPAVKPLMPSISQSPLYRAMALILQHPDIYTACYQTIEMVCLDGPEQVILQQILAQLAQQPKLGAASLIELWREAPCFDLLTKLASWDHQLSSKILVQEFISLIFFLQKQNVENKINQYLTKSREQGLTADERLLLQTMLKERSQNVHDKK